MSILVSAIEDALAVAYRKSFDSDEDIKVTLNQETGDFTVISRRVVIDSEERKNRIVNTLLKKQKS